MVAKGHLDGRMSGAYYNDNDPFAAAWLRELIKAGLIAPGEVDERSIEKVKPDDLRGFTQCHFFAGIGVWSYALRGAGWPDNEPVWTGSCPCPPFSSVGIKKACPQCEGTNPVPHVGRTGFFVCCLCEHEWLADARHLWPELWRLISVGRPDSFFGEQVASDDGRTWFASVRASMEILGYAVGAADLCSAGVGASDIRQRLFFVADSSGERRQQNHRRAFSNEGANGRQSHADHVAASRGAVGVMGESDRAGSQPRHEAGATNGHRDATITASGLGLLEHTAVIGHAQRTGEASVEPERASSRETEQRFSEVGELDQSESNRRIGRENDGDEGRRQCSLGSASPLNGFWRDAEWIYCQDEKWRPVEPGSFPLAHGTTNRVGRLRGYGNAINAEVAKAFIEAYMSL